MRQTVGSASFGEDTSLADATGAGQGMDGMGKDEPSSSSHDQLSLSLITDVIDGL